MNKSAHLANMTRVNTRKAVKSRILDSGGLFNLTSQSGKICSREGIHPNQRKKWVRRIAPYILHY